jgi:hypothetical protein
MKSSIARRYGLVPRVIVDKNGRKMTVYVRVDANHGVEDKKKEVNVEELVGKTGFLDTPKGMIPITVRKRLRLPEKEKHVVSAKRQKVFSQKELDADYREKHPETLRVVEEGKWKKLPKERTAIQLSEAVWKKILKEHEPFVHTMAKKYSFGQVHSERYNELKQVGDVAVHEAINMYGKHLLKFKKEGGTKPTIKQLVYRYVIGRVKETVHNRMIAGLRVPSYLESPYQKYKEVKARLTNEIGQSPSSEQLALELQKIWTKKDFYPSYVTAEDRDYGTVVVKKKGHASVTRQKRFTDLSSEQQEEERKKDVLPMEGWLSVSKKTVAKNKLERHQDNLQKIQDEHKEALENLEKEYENSQYENPESKRRKETVLKELEEKANEARKEMLIKLAVRDKKAEQYHQEMTQLASKLENAVPGSEEAKSIALQLRKFEGTKYWAEMLKEVNPPYYKAKEVYEQAKKELEQHKHSTKELDQSDLEQRKQQLERDRLLKVEHETQRFNADEKSSRIYGLLERVKEFEQIDAVKEVPLGVTVDEEGSETPTVELVRTDEDLTPQEIEELKVTHEEAREVLNQSFDKLRPIYGEAFRLHIGMHSQSKPTADKLWGELMSDDEILRFMERKHKNKLKVPSSAYAKRFAKYGDTDLYRLQGAMPFVAEKYRNDFRGFQQDFERWHKNKPRAKNQKVKLERKEFKEAFKKWLRANKKAREEWKSWRIKHRSLPQSDSVKKYVSLKKKYHAGRSDKPKRFMKRKVTPTKEDLKIWRSRMPKLFYDSESGKRKWINSTLQDAKHIVRATTPKEYIRNWLVSHRKLVEHGIALEKAFVFDEQENAKWQSFFARRELFETLYETNLEKSTVKIMAA